MRGLTTHLICKKGQTNETSEKKTWTLRPRGAALIRRPTQPQLIVTFHTTAAAFQLEQRARAQGFGGRLIPIPRALSAGCGLAWREEPESETALRAMMVRENIEHEQCCVLVL